ncbi:MAG: sugar lactone lactonase YvrE [Cognaticolwellia sp.]|jgi:sugar lactone lactonase YvrE
MDGLNIMSTAVIVNLLKIIPCQCQLGEGVLWHVEQQAIYWLDIEAGYIYRYFVVNEVMEKFTLPQRIGSFAFTPIDDQIIAAFEQGIARYNLKTSSLEWISQPELHIRGNRFNDGRADKQGRFWAGTMVENASFSEQQANLYCIDHQLNCHKKIDHLLISNSLCWNKAGDILFHTDSPSHKIFQYDFSEKTGDITNKRLFTTTSDSTFPDGSTIDAQDYLWNAQWGGSKVVRYDRNGNIDLSIFLPVSQPSSIAIGGPNLDWLIITTAKQSLPEQKLLAEPLAGNVFIYQLTGVTGLIEPKCTI